MEIWTNPECLRLLCDWERLRSAGLRSSELFVPARHFVARHDLVTRILVKVRRVRRSLHLKQREESKISKTRIDKKNLWRDGWVEAAAIEALPVEALQEEVEQLCSVPFLLAWELDPSLRKWPCIEFEFRRARTSAWFMLWLPSLHKQSLNNFIFGINNFNSTESSRQTIYTK